MFARFGLLLASLLVTLVVLEGGFRALDLAPRYPEKYTDVGAAPGGNFQLAPNAYIRNGAMRIVYPDDPRGYFGPGNVVEHFHNARGFRDADRQLQKPPGVFRIVGLGDSYLWGQGVRRPDVVLRRTARLLRERGALLEIEPINLGVAGSSSEQHLALLRDPGLAYSPDLVLLHFVLNDIEPDITAPGQVLDFYDRYLAHRRPAEGWLARSVLWRWIHRRWVAERSARRYIDDMVAAFSQSDPRWERCRVALDEMVALTRAAGVPFAVVVFPFFIDLDGDYPFQPIHDIVGAHLRGQGVPLLDLRGAFPGFRGPELWVHPETDQHPNEIAHAIAGQAIAGWLTANEASLLKGLYAASP